MIKAFVSLIKFIFNLIMIAILFGIPLTPIFFLEKYNVSKLIAWPLGMANIIFYIWWVNFVLRTKKK